ncbi:MAG: carbamoyltransferase C-terminal domain-containing protein [Bacteroidota bacterium]
MNILGINGLGVLPSACLVIDGKLIAFAEEERFTRYKGSFGVMPAKAVKFCLDYAGLSLKDIDYVSFGWDSNKYKFYMPFFLILKYFTRSPKFQKSSNLISFVNELIKYHPQNVKSKIFEMFKDAGIEGNIPPIKFISHHLSHAASAYYLSGYSDSYILIIDGSGEDNCTSIYKASQKEIKLYKSIKVPDSLGWFYQSFTEFLGFSPNNHEGKLMGLAAYGKENLEIKSKIDSIINTDLLGNYKYKARFSFLGEHTQGKVYSEELVSLFGKPRLKDEEISDYHRDLAYACQAKLEEIALTIVRNLIKNKDFIGNLCIAGGVGLNCKMNGAIAELSEIKNLYIPSIPSDAGTSIGSALVLANKMGAIPNQKIEHAYWGTEYSNEYIENLLIKFRLKYKKTDTLEIDVAHLLMENKVIGWFQGRMESGSRALGARSILANPLKKEMQDIINKKVKNREKWRPFAASILFEEKENFVFSSIESPFMAIAFKVKPEIIEKIPSAIHIDNTTRPQFVKKSVNEKYWKLIYEFGKLSGVSAILNTSFNTNEEPIVENPEQAIKAFFGSGMDCLAIGCFLLEK